MPSLHILFNTKACFHFILRVNANKSPLGAASFRSAIKVGIDLGE